MSERKSRQAGCKGLAIDFTPAAAGKGVTRGV